ncbi:MerR family transcriptional regulator [Bacterioplanoides sp.]|uniref:MerR family transcriptional regulator n=1 Tax=Bacterioplanoides sp. TaxID=2066072 RepID=UPI003B5C0544
MSQTYSIRDLADEFDITTRTIRFYEAEGMLQPQREGQTRIYSPQDRVTLKLILRGKRLGLSLAQSRELIEMYTPGQTPEANRPQLEKLLAVIEDRRAHLRQQLHDIERMMEDLDDAELKAREALS